MGSLENERNVLFNSFGYGPWYDGRVRDRLAEIDNILSSDARKICRAFDAAEERDSTEIGI